MSLFSVVDTIGDLRRFREIVTLLFEEGFVFFVERTKIRWAVPIECKIRCFLKSCVGMWDKQPKENLSVKVRELLINLGPSFVKLGQVLSLRPDILPQELCKELEELTDDVPSFSFKEAKNILESELQKPVNKLFKQFDEKPIAAASLAQVHKAVLLNGQRVAVKIQRPGIRSLIEKDIHIMIYLSKVIEERIPEWRVCRPVAVVKEFAETIMIEIDFTAEAVHAKRFMRMFTNDPTVKVARIFDEYSTKNVLTMEYIAGVKVDDLKGLEKIHINTKELAQNGVNAFLRQVFVEGFFHADPHPGNYFALSGNVFGFIDYGMVGRLDSNDRRELASLFISFINKDTESAIEHIKHLVEITENSNISSFEHDIDDVLNQWYEAKLREVSLASAFFKIIESGRKNQIYFPSSLVLLGKTLFTIEAMGFKLDPDFDFGRQMAPFIKKILKAELSPSKIKQKIEDRALDYFSYLEALPEMTAKLLEKIDKGEIGVKINQDELKELEVKLSWEGYKKLLATIIGSSFFAFGAAYLVESKLLNLHFSISTFGIIFILTFFFLILRRK